MQDPACVSLRQFITQVQAAEYRDYAHTRVRDAASLEMMKLHILSLYADLDSPGGVVLPGGHAIDFIPADRQPALRGRPLESPPDRPPELDPTAPPPPAVFDVHGDAMACPNGHVPMPRVTLDRLTGFPTLRHFLSKDGEIGRNLDPEPQGSVHKYARGSQNVANWGGRGTFNVWKPAVDGSTGQVFSLMQVWISSGDAKPKQTVEAGWHVYPAFYGGNAEVHFFTYFTSNNYDPGHGCYNLTCKGFVQTSNVFAPGMPITSVSARDGNQVEFALNYIRKSETGAWWLYYNGEPLGYYPMALFGKGPLSQQANRVSFGCETDGDGSWPPMGSGAFPDEGYGKAAYMRELYYWDTQSNPNASELAPYEDHPEYYRVSIGTPDFGPNSLFSGGPGSKPAIGPGRPCVP